MRFAKIVFGFAGVWGFLVMTPLYFLFDEVGRQYPPPVTHPDFYYGFIAVTLAWQVAFLIISTDPYRYRPLMTAAILEKFLFIASMFVLYAQRRIDFGQLAVASPDFVLGILFTAAFIITGSMAQFRVPVR